MDTRYEAGPRVVHVPADDPLSVADDKPFHDRIAKYELYALGVEPLS